MKYPLSSICVVKKPDKPLYVVVFRWLGGSKFYRKPTPSTLKRIESIAPLFECSPDFSDGDFIIYMGRTGAACSEYYIEKEEVE